MPEQRAEGKSAEIQGINKEHPKRQRRSWTPGEKRRLVEQWHQSGLSRSAFCRENGLSYSAFLLWGQEVALGVNDGLVEVKVSGRAKPESASERFELAELIAPNGWRLRLPFGFDRREIAALMEVMRGC